MLSFEECNAKGRHTSRCGKELGKVSYQSFVPKLHKGSNLNLAPSPDRREEERAEKRG